MFTRCNSYGSGKAVVLFCLWVALVSTDRASGQATQLNGAQTRILTNLQTGNSYTVSVSDCGKLLSLSNTNGMAVTLPQAGASGLNTGCWIDIQNTGAGAVNFAANGSLIDGTASLSLTTNQGLRLVSNGTAYFTQRGQGSGGASGSLAIQSGGVALGSSSTLNIVAGTGVSCIPQLSGVVTTFQCNSDTAYLATKASLQDASNPQLCTSTSGDGSAYTAACASALPAYSPTQTLFWFPDVNNTSTTPSLSIDALGAKPLVRHNGASLAVNDIQANTLYRIWYDGTSIHVVEAGLGSGFAPATTTTTLASIDLGPMVAVNGYGSGAQPMLWGLGQNYGMHGNVSYNHDASYYMAFWQWPNTNANSIERWLWIPADYNPAGSTNVTFDFGPDADGGTANFAMLAAIACVTPGTTIGPLTPNTPAATGPVPVAATAYVHQQATTGDLTMSGCSAGSYAQIYIGRDIGVAGNSDTTLDLFGVKLNYTRK